MDVYEKPTGRSLWLLGLVALRELLRFMRVLMQKRDHLLTFERHGSLSAALLLWGWVYVSAFVLSFLPKIQIFRGQLSLESNAYLGKSFVERIETLFYHWDTIQYIGLSRDGYQKGSETLAFFPGWPWLLSLLPKPAPKAKSA